MSKIRLDRLDPQPAGFGSCKVCSYRDVGTAAICFACVSANVEAPGSDRCVTCDQHTDSDGRCGNYWCRKPPEDRYWDMVWAIAMRNGALETTINLYKFNDTKRGWAGIFGRTLVGYLDDQADVFSTYDMIIPMPTYTGPGARRTWDHIGLIIEKAAIEATGRWPFYIGSKPIVEKTKDSPSMSRLKMYERRDVAETDLRGALVVPRPELVAGQSILVFDDVFTEGSTLREVARVLKRAGAESVSGLALARQPWAP